MAIPAPLVLGHRGSYLRAPENTLAGFRLAMEEGADGVELDVRGAAEGVVVVIHDETLERTHGLTTRVADYEPGVPGYVPEENGVPTLDATAAWAAEAGAWLNVELKEPGLEASTLRTLQEHGVTARTFVSSFLPEVVTRFREIAPELPRFLLTKRWTETEARHVHDAAAHGVCLERAAAADSVLEELRGRGLDIVVWTVNDPREAEHLLEQGVSCVITNDPAAMAHLAARRAHES